MVNGVGGVDVHYRGSASGCQPWNFRGAQRDGRALRRRARSRRSRRSRTGRSTTTSSSPTTTRSSRTIGVSGQAGNVKGAPRRRQPVRGPAAPDYPLPPLRRTRLDGAHGAAARGSAGTRSRPRGDPLGLRRPAGVHVLRLLHRQRLHVARKGSTDVSVIPRAEATGACGS